MGLDPSTIKVYRGANGQYTLYEDDGISEDYLEGKPTLTLTSKATSLVVSMILSALDHLPTKEEASRRRCGYASTKALPGYLV
jgi:hypothetical protein